MYKITLKLNMNKDALRLVLVKNLSCKWESVPQIGAEELSFKLETDSDISATFL
jgi:hypothetical protein